MQKRYFVESVTYISWVNHKIISWLEQIDDNQWSQKIPSSFSSVRETVLHLVSAEKIWLDFWQQHPNPVFLSREFDGDKRDLLQIWKHTTATLTEYISDYPEHQYGELITFAIRNEDRQLTFWETFTHFLNHATYHRGQLVTLLRQTGFQDFSSTDLATYYHLRQLGQL